MSEKKKLKDVVSRLEERIEEVDREITSESKRHDKEWRRLYDRYLWLCELRGLLR